MKVQNFESYLIKVDWDVGTAMKTQTKDRLRHPTVKYIHFSPLFDVQLNDKQLIRSGELTYGHASSSVGEPQPQPAINFEFFIEKASNAETTLYAKLKSNKFEFRIGSADVRFNDYVREYFGFSLLFKEQLELEYSENGPTALNRSWPLGPRSEMETGAFVHWEKVKFPNMNEIFNCLEFTFLINPKVENRTVVPFPVDAISHPVEHSKNPNASALFSPKFSDVKICCGNKQFPAHGVIICQRSKVFEAQFDQPMKEALTGRMDIDDFEPEIVEEFLRFLYTDAVSDLPRNCFELLIIADKYDVQDLKALSEKAILNSISDGNVLEIYELGNLGNSEPVMRQCVERIKRNKRAIWKSEADCDKSCKKHPELLRKVLGLTFSTYSETVKVGHQQNQNHHEVIGENRAGCVGNGKKQRTE